jgi:hypothetical protein
MLFQARSVVRDRSAERILFHGGLERELGGGDGGWELEHENTGK